MVDNRLLSASWTAAGRAISAFSLCLLCLHFGKLRKGSALYLAKKEFFRIEKPALTVCKEVH
jgi:hypothetical protein